MISLRVNVDDRCGRGGALPDLQAQAPAVLLAAHGEQGRRCRGERQHYAVDVCDPTPRGAVTLLKIHDARLWAQDVEHVAGEAGRLDLDGLVYACRGARDLPLGRRDDDVLGDALTSHVVTSWVGAVAAWLFIQSARLSSQDTGIWAAVVAPILAPKWYRTPLASKAFRRIWIWKILLDPGDSPANTDRIEIH